MWEDTFYEADGSATFREQNNGEKWDRSTQEAKVDPLMNLVRVLAHIVAELWKLPGTTCDMPTCTFYDKVSARTVSSKDALEYLRRIVQAIKKDSVGSYLMRQVHLL